LVIGDPCKRPGKLDESFTDPFEGQSTTLRETAPELACNASNQLEGATYSDHGYPIIGPFSTDDGEIGSVTAPSQHIAAGDPTFGYGEMCVMRQRNGYNSGMGLIFHLAASIAPIENSPALPLPQVSSDLAESVADKAALPHKFALPPGPQPLLLHKGPMAGRVIPPLQWASTAVLGSIGVSLSIFLVRRCRATSTSEQHSSTEMPEYLE
jgi:hypothetical protein